MKLLSSAAYEGLVSEARETASVRAAMSKLLAENERLSAIANQLTKQFNDGTGTVGALTRQFRAVQRRAGELATLNIRLAHVAEQVELVARSAVEQSEQATQIAKEAHDMAEATDLLAETLEVVLDNPDRLEECGRNSLVAYRHLLLDTKGGTA